MGEDDYTDRLKFHVQRIQEKKTIYFPDVNAKMSFVHAADAARFMGLLAQTDLPGPVNCCAKEPMVLRDLIRMIEGKTGQTAKLVSSAVEGEESPYGVDGDWYMNTDKQRSTGFECTPIREWITILIARLMNLDLLPKHEEH
jgi:nucleoside-diphosphate-sugar epimerase